MTQAAYCKLSDKSKIGLTYTFAPESIPAGPSLPICIKGSLATKTRSYFKPKIPKTGDNLYKSFYIRKSCGFAYIYDIGTTIFVASHPSIDEARNWIDKNERKIHDRINSLTN